MAFMELTPLMGKMNKITDFSFTAASDAADGFQVKLPRSTGRQVVVLVQNTGKEAATFTVKKPKNESYYAACADEVHSVEAGGFGIFCFENAKWANRDGTMLFVPENEAVKAAVLY